jgi:hypothetical protein
LPRVVSVVVLPRYRVRIRFADGAEGEVDLAGLVGQGVFAAWADPAEFAKVRVDPETHTLAWPGDIDLCPDALYEDAIGRGPAPEGPSS